jgi:predicted nucleic acid-binding protein
MTLVDTNVLLDIVTRDAAWSRWSLAQLEKASDEGPLIINDVIYAELAVRYAKPEYLDEFVRQSGLIHRPMPKQALFLAGKAFGAYRKRGGTRTGVLPDFFIGAHASSEKLPLLTRDARRYRTYFPDIDLLTPES